MLDVIERARAWVDRAIADGREPHAVLTNGCRGLFYNGCQDVFGEDVAYVLDELMRRGLVTDRRTLH